MSAHCTSCGLPIPDGQGSSCSMCYGDVAWGKDGYYADWMERAIREEEEQRARQEQAEEQRAAQEQAENEHSP